MEIWENLSLENIWYEHPETGILVEEEWRDIPEWEGSYQISILGRIKSLDRLVKAGYGSTKIFKGKVLKQKEDKDGYLGIGLYRNQKGKWKRVHQLVGKSFIQNPENKSQINHKKGIKKDNRAWEIEWCTGKENMNHAHQTGLKNNNHTLGELCNFSKIKEEDVLFIRANYNKKILNQKKLGDMFNISDSLVSMILRRIIWKHI